jgi:hypothetical protein
LAWKPEELHCITSCCCFWNYNHIIKASQDSKLINNGEFPISLGSYTTIPKASRGKTIDCYHSQYLDIIHVKFAFGDCAYIGSFKYALIFVDHATCYNWTFGLKLFKHDDILASFMAFRDKSGLFAKQFQCNCDKKLFGSGVRSFLFCHLNNSSITASPAGCQSSNGLVKSHWKIMVHTPHAYLMEKQMPCSYRYFVIKHIARMMNMIPGKYRSKLVSPFMLVHGVPLDQRAWLTLFSTCYFHHTKDRNTLRSKNQAHTLWGIVIGCSSMPNGLLVYNPRNQMYYKPDSYQLDPYHLPFLIIPQSDMMGDFSSHSIAMRL